MQRKINKSTRKQTKRKPPLSFSDEESCKKRKLDSDEGSSSNSSSGEEDSDDTGMALLIDKFLADRKSKEKAKLERAIAKATKKLDIRAKKLLNDLEATHATRILKDMKDIQREIQTALRQYASESTSLRAELEKVNLEFKSNDEAIAVAKQELEVLHNQLGQKKSELATSKTIAYIVQLHEKNLERTGNSLFDKCERLLMSSEFLAYVR